MTYSFNPKYSLLLLSMTLAAGSAVAGSESAFSHQVSKDQIYAGMVAEVERDSQGFANHAENDQLRHRVREQDGKGSANQERAKKQHKHQHKTMNQYQYQSGTGSYSQPMNSSGSMNRGGGNRGGGGGGRR